MKPIGNLKDITLRSLEVLKEVEYIFCEDTRRTKRFCLIIIKLKIKN
jgi:16S rRNA C1402 (ribose-2'-O) methylase RsmI